MTDGLRFEFQWEAAEDVNSPELRATWSRFRLFIGDDCLTLVQDHFTGEVRNWLDVPTYPLAEWVAMNWWFLTTPANISLIQTQADVDSPLRREKQQFLLTDHYSLASAGSGFPWPHLKLIPEKSCYLATVFPAENNLARVSFLGRGDYVLEFGETVRALAKLVDSTCRKLEDVGIQDTPLQVEWAAIQELDVEEEAFCAAAATLGFDPFEMEDATAHAIVDASKVTDDTGLFLELLSAVEPEQVVIGSQWLAAALARLGRSARDAESTSATDLKKQVLARSDARPPVLHSARTPWVIGYQRARLVRQVLGVPETQPIDIDDLVESASVRRAAPERIQALGSWATGTLVSVVGPDRATDRRRHFTQARTLSRYLFDGGSPTFIVAHGTTIRDRSERAFAAELLVPARGLEELLEGQFSNAARDKAARHFGVNRLVVEHQLENQLGVAALW